MSTTADAMPAEGGRISWFRYVPHGKVARYRAAGWSVVDGPVTHHQAYSMLMKYDGPASDVEPPEPRRQPRVLRLRTIAPRWRR